MRGWAGWGWKGLLTAQPGAWDAGNRRPGAEGWGKTSGVGRWRRGDQGPRPGADQVPGCSVREASRFSWGRSGSPGGGSGGEPGKERVSLASPRAEGQVVRRDQDAGGGGEAEGQGGGEEHLTGMRVELRPQVGSGTDPGSRAGGLPLRLQGEAPVAGVSAQSCLLGENSSGRDPGASQLTYKRLRLLARCLQMKPGFKTLQSRNRMKQLWEETQLLIKMRLL